VTHESIKATYWIETPLSLDQAAECMAGEQSTGTFTRVPGETDELRERHAARVESIRPLDTVEHPSLSSAARPTADNPGYKRGEVVLSFPVDNIGPNLPTIFSTVAGNLFELRQLTGLKLLDVDFPASLGDQFDGPQFGIAGTRSQCGVHGRPIIGTIVKPSVGLSPSDTANLVRELGEAGLDFIKDDELMADPPHSLLRDRVAAVMAVINELADRTGRKLMFAFNISDRADRMRVHHDVVRDAGGTCVMVSLNSVGMVGVEQLRSYSELPIHGHRNGWGMFSRSPFLGLEFRAYQKFWRLAGVDHLHVNGLQNKFCESDDSVVRSIQSLLEPLCGGLPAMPVVSSGQWGGQAPETIRRTQTTDQMYVAGGGIIAHPLGPAAGVTAIRQAWEAAAQEIDLADYAVEHEELRASLKFYGSMAHVK
jgi:ribulose-bisphosphate carboxylase large chain